VRGDVLFVRGGIRSSPGGDTSVVGCRAAHPAGSAQRPQTALKHVRKTVCSLHGTGRHAGTTTRHINSREATMTNHQPHQDRNLRLAKLGIREIHERIEVSPILTDPGTGGFDASDGTPKSYVCTINFPGDIYPNMD
jgi:hypothetical protein